MGIIKIHNGQVITPAGILPRGTVVVEGGTIVRVGNRDVKVPGMTGEGGSSGDVEVPGTGGEVGGEEGAGGDVVVIDAGWRYVAPGFIDLHVHGGGGHDFMDGTVEAFLGVAALHARHGTTAMLATTLSCSLEKLFQILDVYGDVKQMFLGIHLEGPYLAMAQRGAQDARYLRHPDRKEYLEILARCPEIRRWSAAPELEGALEFGRLLRERGIVASFAHTDALYAETLEGFRNGFTLATHLYSCMNGVTRRGVHRYAGAVECAYLVPEIDIELIADGVHLPAPLLQLAYWIKGAERTVLVTDAMRAAGMGEGESVLGGLDGGLRVIVEDGVAKLPDRSAFAGSVATADRLIRTMVSAGIPLAEAVQMMTATPARIMGVDGAKGTLEAGKDADIIIFDEEVNVALTMIGGRVVYENL